MQLRITNMCSVCVGFSALSVKHHSKFQIIRKLLWRKEDALMVVQSQSKKKQTNKKKTNKKKQNKKKHNPPTPPKKKNKKKQKKKKKKKQTEKQTKQKDKTKTQFGPGLAQPPTAKSRWQLSKTDCKNVVVIIQSEFRITLGQPKMVAGWLYGCWPGS